MHSSRREMRSRRMPGPRANDLTQFQRVLILAAGRPVFTADFYAVDGVTTKVASFIDWNDPTHTLAQALSGNQVAVPATHADFGGKLCATFAGGQYYTSTRAASYWSYANNTPMDFFATHSPTSVAGFSIIWETGLADGTDAQNLALNTTTVTAILQRASGGNQSITRASGAAVGVPVLCEVRADETTNPARGLKVTGFAETTAVSITGAQGTPSATLTLGGRGGGSQFYLGRWRHLLALGGTAGQGGISSADRTTVQQYILQDSGLAA